MYTVLAVHTVSQTAYSIASSTDDDDDNTGAIVGGVVGGIAAAILLILLIILICYCYMKKRGEKSSIRASTYGIYVSDRTYCMYAYVHTYILIYPNMYL